MANDAMMPEGKES